MMVSSSDRPDTAEFLAGCHPSICEFHAYWDGKRRGRSMPSRADLDPAEMVPYLPNLILVDVESVEPLSLVYRVVGTREVAARGMDPTHRKVAEGFYCSSREAALANYRRVIEGRMPVVGKDVRESPHSRLSEHGSIFLPLSDDDRTVNKVIVYTAYTAH